MADIPELTLADRLKLARRHAGFTSQMDLAREIGHLTGATPAQNTMSRAELGRNRPHRSLLVAWARACGVNQEWLITGKVPSDQGDQSSAWKREIPAQAGWLRAAG